MKNSENKNSNYILTEIDSCSITDDIEKIIAVDITNNNNKILFVYENHITIYSLTEKNPENNLNKKIEILIPEFYRISMAFFTNDPNILYILSFDSIYIFLISFR
jgi:hypothetical protein